jgi:inhibitor of cysteine peptidase
LNRKTIMLAILLCGLLVTILVAQQSSQKPSGTTQRHQPGVIFLRYGEAPEMLEIGQDENGREVTLAVGGAVELSLAENRTTGYHWELKESAEPICELVKDEFEPSSGPPGSGGVHRWRFEAVKPGSGKIRLQYRRPWEKNTAPARTYEVSVRVHS